MASSDYQYDHANYKVHHQAVMSAAVAAAGVVPQLTFRSLVKATVTKIGVMLNSVSSVTLILTLLIDGSILAILTLSNSANEVAREFTLTANRTLDTFVNRLEVSGAKDKGDLTVIYQYRIVPGTTFSLAAAIS